MKRIECSLRLPGFKDFKEVFDPEETDARTRDPLSTITSKIVDSDLVFTISTDSIVALRAIMNTILRSCTIYQKTNHSLVKNQ